METPEERYGISFTRIRILEDRIIINVQGGYEYEIGFDTLENARDVCDWLGQIAEKTWGSPVVLGELVMAFNIVLDDLRRL